MGNQSLKLPKEFEKHRSELEKTVKSFVCIHAERGETTLYESKFGGKPYPSKNERTSKG
ncbi:hypothetical protein ACFWGC_10070 [Cytobacillus pseudoceanisediminis]|uniref:hypothetical protein n=1 Tax=Cytobacillus pseudoceanisediminis TaxID=3051614 RepID=UPI0036478381